MAYTFYPKQTNASLAAFMPNMAQFLNNNLMGFTGPGWLVVEVYSQNAAIQHANPAGGNITALAGDNSWIGGSAMTAGDYIIFESASAANKFQVGFEYFNGTTIYQIAAPREGWNTGAGTNNMQDAGNWTLPYLPNVSTTSLGAGQYSIVADADHCNYFYDDGVNRCVELIGKLNNTYSSDTTTSVVIYSNPSSAYSANNAGLFSRNWYKLSSVDQASTLSIYEVGLITCQVIL